MKVERVGDWIELALVALVSFYLFLRLNERWDGWLFGVLSILGLLLIIKVYRMDHLPRPLHMLLWTVSVLSVGWLLGPVASDLPLAVLAYAGVCVLIWVSGALGIRRIHLHK